MPVTVLFRIKSASSMYVLASGFEKGHAIFLVDDNYNLASHAVTGNWNSSLWDYLLLCISSTTLARACE